ncbi:MAG: class I SAM-dependent DNA methyltransferase [Methylobacteriaceae bacterium]|nr:class I SAM-dependent DNA methyltransferase [Methylobacteriaceae bacterium]
MSVEAFITRWQGRHGGQERANYALFLTELCDALGLPHPDPASAEHADNDYVFERVVREAGRDGTISNRRIDLYKRDAFVLEAKQSRQVPGGDKQVQGQTDLILTEAVPRGRRGADRAWDVLMLNARRQAEDYVRLLPRGHEPPPFVIVCDVGHCLEVYANFRRDGKAFDQFPDRQSFRIYLEDLRKPEVQDQLKAIWKDPASLDPARRSARVTRAIAERLAKVSKALEKDAHPADEVAMFLMRCLFTMFAEDVGLLPENSFKEVLERCEREPDTFQHDVGQLWEAMNTGGYAHAIREKVPRFNGEFFLRRTVLPLAREEIGELKQAAGHDWRDVDPSIFGTLLEQALDPDERRRLGAHYTPRAYVERLVIATVIEPLRDDWGKVLSTAERQKSEGRNDDALATVRAFHDALCATRVLDPACGTGNFLYVSLELLKRLEGEVLEALVNLGGQEALVGLEGHSVDPHQFLGMELNPRAAAIAELVLWIGHLQWHVRTRGGMPSEPILRAFKNIVVKDAVLAPGQPPRRPEWPAAEYIVGNPPFIGSKFLRARLGDDYTEALWAAHPNMNESADFVMYWWDRAAELLTRKATALRRFGLVTTNSITQSFQSRVLQRHLKASKPVSLVMAIPDHPWSKATTDAAAVRIAMTVVEAGVRDGALREVTNETGLDTDTPIIDLSEKVGIINSGLSIGVDATSVSALRANDGICSPGVKLHGAGFIVTRQEADHLGLGKRNGLERHIRPYRNGRDLTTHPRNSMVIDLFGLNIDQVRNRFPEVYQHVLTKVKPERDANNRATYRTNWWVFGEPRSELRPALKDVQRYVATPVTQKHRTFEFLPADILPDDALMVAAVDDAFVLGVMQSRSFSAWFNGTASTLEDRPRFIKSRCFDPFPFPVADDLQKQRIRVVAEAIDAHRKRVLAEHPHLTLTGLYNVLEELRAGVAPDALEPASRKIFDDGLVLILKEEHDKLDVAVADAYGWPVDLADEDVLARLVALNKERAQEEARGVVQWLRPDYQIPLLGTPKEKAELDLVGGEMATAVAQTKGPKPAFPTDDISQTAAVMSVLAAASAAVDAVVIATTFKQGRRIAPKVSAVLTALARTGFVTSPDGGRTFELRRAA